MRLGTRKAKTRPQQEWKVEAAGGGSHWEWVGISPQQDSPPGRRRSGQPFTAEMLAWGGFSAQSITFPLRITISRATRHFSRRHLVCSFHAALLPASALFMGDQLSPRAVRGPGLCIQ